LTCRADEEVLLQLFQFSRPQTTQRVVFQCLVRRVTIVRRRYNGVLSGGYQEPPLPLEWYGPSDILILRAKGPCVL